MGNMPRRRRWLRIAGVVAVVYGVLWAATAVWGPDALQRWEDRRHFDHYTQMGMNPSGGKRQLVSFSVPAPFLVGTTWRYESRGPDGRVGDSCEGDVWAVWVCGWLGVCRDQMHWVACG